MPRRLRLPKNLKLDEIEQQLRDYPGLEEELAKYRIPMKGVVQFLDHSLHHDISAESDSERSYRAQRELLKDLSKIRETLLQSTAFIDGIIAPALRKVPLMKANGSVKISSASKPGPTTHQLKVLAFPPLPPKEIGNLRELAVRIHTLNMYLDWYKNKFAPPIQKKRRDERDAVWVQGMIELLAGHLIENAKREKKHLGESLMQLVGSILGALLPDLDHEYLHKIHSRAHARARAGRNRILSSFVSDLNQIIQLSTDQDSRYEIDMGSGETQFPIDKFEEMELAWETSTVDFTIGTSQCCCHPVEDQVIDLLSKHNDKDRKKLINSLENEDLIRALYRRLKDLNRGMMHRFRQQTKPA